MSVVPPSGLGLTASAFMDILPDAELRRFFDPRVVSVLDALFGGQIGGDNLRRVAKAFLDFDSLLGDKESRRRVLRLIPKQKQSELETRVGRSIGISHDDDWSDTEVRRLREFFGCVEERIAPLTRASTKSIVPNYGLFDHQRNAVQRLIPLLTQGDRRAILHLPTGAGKTRTAMHVVASSLRKHEPSVVVWLASSSELLEQSVAAFEQAWMHLGTRALDTGAMWGDRSPNLESFTDGFLAVGLSKGWAAFNSEPDWALRMSKWTRLVVFDEAHQSIARTYRRIADELTLDYRCGLLGLTATPGRTWADTDKDGELAEFYSGNKVTLEVPGENPIEYLVENEYLARTTFRTLLSAPGLVMTETERSRIARALEIPPEVVTALSVSEQYISAVLGAIDDLLRAGHLRVLVFAATVKHAEILSAILLANDVRSRAVTGQTPRRIREDIIRSFKSDDETPMVLVNYGVLTTGFDAPRVSAAVIARPTQSLVLFSQMIGRVIRGPKVGGTATCEVVTVVDPDLPAFGDIAEAFLNWEDVWQ